MSIKYFISKYLNQTPNGEKYLYDCRVVDEEYREVFKQSLNEEEKEAFIRIMSSNKDALLYRTHDKLKELAYLKIDDHTNEDILNANIWP